MKDFDIIERGFLDPIGEPGCIRSTLKIVDFSPRVVGTDDSGDFIYEEITPEIEEKIQWFKYYRLLALKHTKPEAQRSAPDDGVVQKAWESGMFDSRDLAAKEAALHVLLGMAVANFLKL